MLTANHIASLAMFAAVGCLVLFRSNELLDLARFIQEEIDDFGGRDPRPPMHPMPANDAVLLSKRGIKETGPEPGGCPRRAQ